MCVAEEKKEKSIDSYDDEVYHSKVGVQSIYVNDIEDGRSKSHQGLKRSDSSEYLIIKFIKISKKIKNGKQKMNKRNHKLFSPSPFQHLRHQQF